MDGEGTAGQEFVLGKAIANARRRAGMTQQDLCGKANLSYSTLAKIERGAIKTPSIFTVAAIAEATDTPLDELAGTNTAAGPKASLKDYKTAKNGIKFVYFDVNGVMVRYFQRAFTKIAADTGVTPDVVESFFWHYNDAICRNEISLEEFNKLLAEKLGQSEIDWADYYLENVDSINDIRELLEWVTEHYHVGLLTNSMPGILKQMMDRGIVPRLDYSAIIDSSEVGLIKPESAIYQKAAELAKVAPEELLLIDDSRTNLMAAEHLGWHVLWFDDYRPDESAERIRQTLEF
jgi:FMN phosphatase YigB (HAD superfamily)/DNA-binding XRE family transcriptional regulator